MLLLFLKVDLSVIRKCAVWKLTRTQSPDNHNSTPPRRVRHENVVTVSKGDNGHGDGSVLTNQFSASHVRKGQRDDGVNDEGDSPRVDVPDQSASLSKKTDDNDVLVFLRLGGVDTVAAEHLQIPN